MGPLDKVIPFALPGTQPATAGNYGGVFTNVTDQILELVTGEARHETAGNDVGAVTLKIGKAATGVAKGSATDMTGTINLKGTADTRQTLAPSATLANRLLNPGETAFLILTGTPTAVAGLSGTLLFRPFS
jgi:hypothetical protein